MEHYIRGPFFDKILRDVESFRIKMLLQQPAFYTGPFLANSGDFDNQQLY